MQIPPPTIRKFSGQDCDVLPIHIGDEPGDGVITLGLIIPLRLPAGNDQCGPPSSEGSIRLEAFSWAIDNFRTKHPVGPKLGMYFLWNVPTMARALEAC